MSQIDDKTAPQPADKATMSEPEPQQTTPTFSSRRVTSPLGVADALARIASLSKRGKLAGFEKSGEHGFHAAVHGKPFDSVLLCELRKAGGEAGSGCVIEARVRLRRGLPWVFGVVVALSVWPGVLLTDSLLNTWFSWYPNETWKTYVWYVPLTVLPLPWMVRKVMRQSRSSGGEHAAEQIEKIRAAVDGTIEPLA